MAQRDHGSPVPIKGSVVDLRSDTVTKPTAEMYDRMMNAPVADDGLDGDPTAKDLEQYVADLLGKERGLFVPSCTFANMLAIASSTKRIDQVMMEESAHIFTTERASEAITGVIFKLIAGNRGAIDNSRLENELRLDSGKFNTPLVCTETSHNAAGGTAISVSDLSLTKNIADRYGAKVHLDGARLFNAATALSASPASIAETADTVSICLSKGLSAPVGAVLVGDAALIARARKLRKAYGGAQRQVGIVAAAGLVAIETMRDRLGDDHVTATLLSKLINGGPSTLAATVPETNIVQIDVSRSGKDTIYWVDALSKRGVLARPIDFTRIRCVTHRHITSSCVEAAAHVFRDVALEIGRLDHPAAH